LFALVAALSASTLRAQGAAAAPNGARQPDDPEDGQWLRPAKNFASTRYSQLDQIRTDNVKDLKVAWTFSTGLDKGHEAAPIVAGGTMYLITPYPNVLYALIWPTRARRSGNTNPSHRLPPRVSPVATS
jgi:lanthanide-dependent methanol dehydrogenase